MLDNFHSVTHRDHNTGNKNKLCFDWEFFHWPPTLIGWVFIRLTNIHLCTLRHTLMVAISNKRKLSVFQNNYGHLLAIFSHCLNKWLAIIGNYEAIILGIYDENNIFCAVETLSNLLRLMFDILFNTQTFGSVYLSNLKYRFSIKTVNWYAALMLPII